MTETDPESPWTTPVCFDSNGNPFTEHDFTPDGLGKRCRRCHTERTTEENR